MDPDFLSQEAKPLYLAFSASCIVSPHYSHALYRLFNLI